MARELKALLGPDYFIRRDLARRALFVSDYPKRAPEETARRLHQSLMERGFVLRMERGLALIDWPFEGYKAFFDSLKGTPCADNTGGLKQIYLRHPLGFNRDMLEDARLAVLSWDSGTQAELEKRAGEALALALRKKTPAPLYYPLLLS